MSTIVGPLLPEPQYGYVQSLWEHLTAEFGHTGVYNPYPQLSLCALPESVDREAVSLAVRDVARRHEPITVVTDGVGVLPGNHVYLPVARNRRLDTFQRDVVRRMADVAPTETTLFERDRWLPHVGLALGVDSATVGDVVSLLLTYDLTWEFDLEDLAVIAPPMEGREYDLVTNVKL